ncbi:YqaJ viral recombinase family protein [Micromonospora sp. NPDC050695]|uniref:YqaJ viral recombinase family protein n=1 Tax=Micromonospora sp. NPDC050695 TaxID=3154938 RepID=UPI0033EB72F2
MTQTLTGPVPVIGWDATEDEWVHARRDGLGGSDILAVLGFSNYRTPWDVWAEKTGVRSWQDDVGAAADLGKDLEPWLISQANRILGVPVTITEYRTYAHARHNWQRCSPDGLAADRRLVEAKTAGLQSGFGTPAGWADDSIPLGYEFQVRWSLYVMDAPAAEIIALIAGMGVQRRTVVRDMAIEHELVGQVTDWYQQHIVAGVEPPFGRVDNAAMAKLYPTYKPAAEVDLTGRDDAIELWHAYRDARDRESAAKAEKETAGAALKNLIGDREVAKVDGNVVATWSNKKGQVDWPRMVAALVEQHGVPAPNPDEYRKPSTRSLNVKDA